MLLQVDNKRKGEGLPHPLGGNHYHADTRSRPEKTVEHRLKLQSVRMKLQSVRKLVQSLQEVDRTVFLLRVQHDLPYAEIARMMEISVSAAKVKVHRVRLRLAETRVDEDGEQ